VRIVVLAPARLGDFIQASALLRGILDRWPGALLTVAALDAGVVEAQGILFPEAEGFLLDEGLFGSGGSGGCLPPAAAATGGKSGRAGGGADGTICGRDIDAVSGEIIGGVSASARHGTINVIVCETRAKINGEKIEELNGELNKKPSKGSSKGSSGGSSRELGEKLDRVSSDEFIKELYEGSGEGAGKGAGEGSGEGAGVGAGVRDEEGS
jgi:hypothetical protein